MLTLSMNARWSQNGVTVAGGKGRMVMPLINSSGPYGLDIDDDNQSVVIDDCDNHRIVEWKMGEKQWKSNCWWSKSEEIDWIN